MISGDSMKKNNWYYLYRLIRWKLGDRSPVVASLKITQNCNLSCTHCPWKNKIHFELSTEQWKKIIEQVRNRGCTLVTFEGGEPTLRSDLQELIEYGSELGLSTLVVTNGTRDITSIMPDRIWVSIEGLEKANDQIRGRGTFKKAFETLKKNQKKNIVTLTTISKTNYQDLEEMCETLSPYVHGFIFSFLYPYGDTKDQALSPAERSKVAERILVLKERFNVLNSASYLKAVGKGWKCYPWGLICATADGRFQDGCMVRHLEPCNCKECDMACYGELAQAIDMKKDALRFFYDAGGTTDS
jgi:MoaA/NifB/PqqE/SkfB family radical SAM enzyme